MDLTSDDILDTSKLTFFGDFNEQVMEILTRVRLTRTEVENLQCLLNDVESALSYIMPGCQVYPFGSIVTGLGIKTSDIDCFIQLPPSHSRHMKKEKIVNMARNQLRRDPSRFAKLFAITAAKVPIVKFVHLPTGFNCDINFSSFSGVRNSKLIAFLLTLDSRALPLAIIIKYWSKVYKFTGTNLVPNYALTMMVIFYLQVKSILPSVSELQTHDTYLVDNWNTTFNDNFVYVSDNSESLYELLGGFFNYYKTFDFVQYVIAPFMGYPISKKLIGDLYNLPHKYYLYRNNVLNKICKVIRVDTSLCIQDPFEHCRNCSVGVFERLFNKVKAHIEFGADMFCAQQESDFLKAVLTMDQQIEIQRAENTKPHFVPRNKVMKRKNQFNNPERRAKQNFKRTIKYNYKGAVLQYRV